jgi:hypothetical protein
MFFPSETVTGNNKPTEKYGFVYLEAPDFESKDSIN